MDKFVTVKTNVLKKVSVSILSLLASLTLNTPAQAAEIVIANDEWALSNTGFSNAPDVSTFVTNLAKSFAKGDSGKFHAYSTNFGLTESSLASTMTAAGYTWTTGLDIKFDLPTLLNYDGIFLAGNPADNNMLIDYVERGGNVYLAGGTGWGSSVDEAARWNKFLNHFGLEFGSSYNGIYGDVAISSVKRSYPEGNHSLMSGISSLYNADGNEVIVLDSANPHTQVIGKPGLYAVYNSQDITSVPEPSGVLGVLVLGAFGTVSLIKRKKV